jgi:hypothetical protein
MIFAADLGRIASVTSWFERASRPTFLRHTSKIAPRRMVMYITDNAPQVAHN